MTDEFQLPPDTLDKLKTANRIAKRLENEIAKAKIAKIDTALNEERLKAAKEKIFGIRQGYFPNESLG